MTVNRPIAFVLAATDHGTMIVNRNDRFTLPDGRAYGVGHELLAAAHYGMAEIGLLRTVLDVVRQLRGDGLMVLDCGANIGAMTVDLARHMTGWGSILAIEAQERIFYALAGNIAVNNCFNARALHAALAATEGTTRMPVPDYLRDGSFGSLELRPAARNEPIGQPIDYSEAAMVPVPARTIDGLALPRLDVLKIDVEGMELEVIAGAQAAIARHRPVIFAEHAKAGYDRLRAALAELGYESFHQRRDLLACHREDRFRGHVRAG